MLVLITSDASTKNIFSRQQNKDEGINVAEFKLPTTSWVQRDAADPARDDSFISLQDTLMLRSRLLTGHTPQCTIYYKEKASQSASLHHSSSFIFSHHHSVCVSVLHHCCFLPPTITLVLSSSWRQDLFIFYRVVSSIMCRTTFDVKYDSESESCFKSLTESFYGVGLMGKNDVSCFTQYQT